MGKKLLILFICLTVTASLLGCMDAKSGLDESVAARGQNEGEEVENDIEQTQIDKTEEDSSDLDTENKEGTVLLYIVRHGKSMLNTTDRVQGWADAVLTKAGAEVVLQAARGMAKKDLKFDAAYTSDSGRSIQTANIILETVGQGDLHLNTDWRFREFSFGTYEGDLNVNMWTDIAELQGMTFEEWQAEGVVPREFADSVAELDKGRDESGLNWPAEDYETITNRLKEGLDAITSEVSSKGGGKVLLVSHGLSIGTMIDLIRGNYEMPAGGLKNASVSVVEYKDGKYTVLEVGDISYIEAGTEK